MTEITKDWCLNMANAEGRAGDPEVGAGALVHPLQADNDLLRIALNDAKRELAETCQILHETYHKAIKATENARTALSALSRS